MITNKKHYETGDILINNDTIYLFLDTNPSRVIKYYITNKKCCILPYTNTIESNDITIIGNNITILANNIWEYKW